VAQRRADVFVVFGITGDLAKLMTFRALYRLERRGLLDCPVVGVAVDDWTIAKLRRHMRTSIAAAGEKIDPKVFARLAKRLSYVQGDFDDAQTYVRVRTALGKARRPLFYLEIPPSLFGTVVSGLSGEGLVRNARVIVEKPFGHDLASARSLAAELHRSLAEEQIFRVDHFLGKLGLEELLYLRSANEVLGPVWNREHVACIQLTLAESFGVEDRGSFYDRVGALRDVVVNHLLQLMAAATMEVPNARETVGDARDRLFRSVLDADPRRYVRGQYTGYRTTRGVAARSTTETFAALELAIDNDRWRGVPVYIRAGKHLRVTATELRLIFHALRDVAHANELVVRLDPGAGIRLILEAHRADSKGPEPITLDMEFADEGGEGPTPYETLFEAAFKGDASLFSRQDTVEEAWRIVQPLLDAPPRLQHYRRGTWGPPGAAKLAGWRTPWTSE
jgi:glucose-6-phosphate 1-dehydrogenase